MKTEQEQIEEMTNFIHIAIHEKCLLNNGGHCIDCDYNTDEKCQNRLVAKELFEAGYGNVSEYKAENEKLTKILNSLTFSRKETDIFGKPKLLMLAGVTVEEAINRATEYDALKTEIERLKAENNELNKKNWSLEEELKKKELEITYARNNGYEKGYDECEEYMKGKIKQAKIDVLKELKERAIGYTFLGEKLATEADIDELIKEVEK